MEQDQAASAGERILWGVGTSRTIRAHWALAELALPYRTRIVRTRTPDTDAPDFIALNPRQKVPVLCDGAVTLTESPAIVTYLGETYPGPGPALVPSDGALRARYFEWLSFIAMELDATSLYVLRRHQFLPEIYGEAPAAVAAARTYFARMIEAAATLIEDGRPSLLGEGFSGADILMGSTLDWATRYELELPALFHAYRDRLIARPAWQAAQEANRIPLSTT